MNEPFMFYILKVIKGFLEFKFELEIFNAKRISVTWKPDKAWIKNQITYFSKKLAYKYFSHIMKLLWICIFLLFIWKYFLYLFVIRKPWNKNKNKPRENKKFNFSSR